MKPGLLDMFLVFLRVGVTAFGAATSEVLIKELIERKGWVSLDEFKESMAVVGLLPGPFHINLVMNLGFGLGGFRGQLLAMTAFVFPSFLLAAALITLLSNAYLSEFLRAHPGIIKGMLAAVTALLANAILKLSKGLFGTPGNFLILPILIAGLWFLKLSFALIILSGGLFFLGLQFYRNWRVAR